MDVCGENFFGGDFWPRHQLYRDATTHTPTFQQFVNPFVVCNLYATRLPVASSHPSQYRCLLERDVRLDRGSSDSNTHRFKNSVTMITNSIYSEAINFFSSATGDITLNFTTWSILLKLWQNHILKGARFVLASGESLSFQSRTPIAYTIQ